MTCALGSAAWVALACAWLAACGGGDAGPAPAESAVVPSSSGAAAGETHDAGTGGSAGTTVPVAPPPPRGGATPAETAELMARAALAGDPARYLALVAAGDAELATEQRNWAVDLRRRTPSELALGLEDLRVEGTAATATLRARWSMPAWREPMSASWPARFVRGEGAWDGWRYAGESWERTEGDGVVVLYLRGSEKAARGATATLPAIRRRVHLALAIPADDALARHTQVVKLYASMAHLQASIYLSYADGLSGWHEPGESLKLLVTAHTTNERLGLVLAHEYTHAATFSLGPAADDMPWWVEEGVAELLAPGAAEPGRGRLEWPAARAAMQQRARAHGVVDFRELADFDGAARAHMDAVYDQGRAMAAFVRTRHGDPGLGAWLRYLGAGASLEDATRETLGTSFADLERAFRAEVAPAR